MLSAAGVSSRKTRFFTQKCNGGPRREAILRARGTSFETRADAAKLRFERLDEAVKRRHRCQWAQIVRQSHFGEKPAHSGTKKWAFRRFWAPIEPLESNLQKKAKQSTQKFVHHKGSMFPAREPGNHAAKAARRPRLYNAGRSFSFRPFVLHRTEAQSVSLVIRKLVKYVKSWRRWKKFFFIALPDACTCVHHEDRLGLSICRCESKARYGFVEFFRIVLLFSPNGKTCARRFLNPIPTEQKRAESRYDGDSLHPGQNAVDDIRSVS